MQWTYSEPDDLTDAEMAAARAMDEYDPAFRLLSVQRETTQDAEMVVTDYATAPEPELCPNCGFDALVERGCKVICTHCNGLIQSCSE